MSAKQVYRLVALLLGYAIIIGAFILWCGFLPSDVMILDMVMLCVIFSVFAEVFFLPMVNLGNKSHKEVGMMGVRYWCLFLFAMVSIGVMVLGAVYHFSFLSQLIGQLVAVFILLMGKVSALHLGEKVERRYHEEKILLQNKETLSLQIESLVDRIRKTRNADPSFIQRAGALADELRYVTPSVNAGALALEEEWGRVIQTISTMLNDYEANKDSIEEKLADLEIILKKRKNY